MKKRFRIIKNDLACPKADDFSLLGTPLSGDRDLDMAIFFGIENS